MPIDPLLKQAHAALKARDDAKACRILRTVIRKDEQSERGWLMLAFAVTAEDEKRTCLRRVLAINPDNAIAREALERLNRTRSAPSSPPVAQSRRAPSKQPAHHAKLPGVSWPLTVKKLWPWVKIVAIATVHAGGVGLGAALGSGLMVIFAGIPVGFAVLVGLCLGSLAVLAVFIFDIREASANLDRTGSVTFRRESLSKVSFGPTSSSYVSSSSDLLPNGYSRHDYHQYGAIDSDVEFWGLDQPGAPPPHTAGWVAMDLLDHIDADGDGFIDDPLAYPFF